MVLDFLLQYIAHLLLLHQHCRVQMWVCMHVALHDFNFAFNYCFNLMLVYVKHLVGTLMEIAAPQG